MRTRNSIWKLALGLALCAAPAWLATPALAQNSTSSLRGTVVDVTGSPVAGAEIVANNSETGYQYKAVSQDNGFYNLTLPPGSYDITVSTAALQPKAETIRVQIGQVIAKDFVMDPSERVSEEITVEGVGDLAVENRTSEVATNVTKEQIENLPQNNRNFLNFAALAPGMRVSDNEFRKEVSSGALAARDTNVFIDGASYKNDVLEGGVVGQDASRGNPFPQNAVQEFRVLTQNYKAEYQKASSAIISAITKSGGNNIHGSVFGFFQNKSMVELEEFADRRGEDKPEYKRYQLGAELGGPIISDRLHYYLTYEGNRQDRANSVFLGNQNSPIAPQLRDQEGFFTSPFRGTLFFGKLSYQPSAEQWFDISANSRHETDVRNFGGQTSFEAAENVKNDVNTLVAKHQYTASSWFNEITLNLQRYEWNPTPTNPDLVGRNYFGILRTGGRDSTQQFTQDRLSLRNDITLTGLQAAGDHVVKIGGNYDRAKYDVKKEIFSNPVFNFRSDLSLEIPFEAQFGVGNPNLNASNNQYGIYVQDDWTPTPRLTFNVGLRWDYESDMLNNDYRTPDDVRQNLAPIVSSRYFTDGDDRDPYTSAIQPRFGVSYDLTGEGKTVIFGGGGRYFDRTLYNYTLDERSRLTYAIRTFRFSTDGAPRDGFPTIVWRPEYFSREGLLGLIANGTAPNPEVFLIDNGTKPPHSDQLSLGIRHQFRSFSSSLSYTNIKSYNGFTWIFGTRRPDGTCCISVNNYANVLLSDATKKTRYNGVFLTLDRPFTAKSRWGTSFAYTYGKGKQNGGDLFSLDFPSVSAYPFYPVDNDQRHTVVMTGIVGLPWDVRFSTLIALGSGTPYTISDASRGFGPNEFRLLRNEGRPEKYDFIIPNAWANRTVDLRLQKDFAIGSTKLGIIAEGFNAFNFKNYGCYNGFIAPTSGAPNPDFGKPGCVINPGRSYQVGLNFSL